MSETLALYQPVQLTPIPNTTDVNIILSHNLCLSSREISDKMCIRDRTSPLNVEEDLLIQENALQIHQRLHALPEPYREVFTLRVFAELPYTQIGELFGKSENWARVTYYRAKQKIKEGL